MTSRLSKHISISTKIKPGGRETYCVTKSGKRLMHDTSVPILRLPAVVFTYLIGRAEAKGQEGKF